MEILALRKLLVKNLMILIANLKVSSAKQRKDQCKPLQGQYLQRRVSYRLRKEKKYDDSNNFDLLY